MSSVSSPDDDPVLSDIPVVHSPVSPLKRARPYRGATKLAAPTRCTAVWHYTSPAGLLGILSTHEFWASSPLTMNDVAEVQYGVNIFLAVWSAMDKSKFAPEVVDFAAKFFENDLLLMGSRDFFLLSASKNGDSLNQWQGYGDGGYAIQIATHVPLVPVLPATAGAKRRAAPGDWYDVVYDMNAQARIALGVITFCLENYFVEDAEGRLVVRLELLNLVTVTCARFKHPAFSAEEEVRFVQPSITSVSPDFRIAGAGIVPYIRLAASSAPHVLADQTRGQLPIISVMTGPADVLEARVKQTTAVRVAISNAYMPAFEKSQAPYRSR